jgi:dihydrolipoamide dehydrogenase
VAHLLSLAVETQMTVADVLAKPFYHPVLEEGLRTALRDVAKGVSRAGGSDISDCKAIGYDALD